MATDIRTAMAAGNTPIDPIEKMVENSYRNFHAKGFDYLCLHRTPELTIKAYFFDRPIDVSPEVVCPHDHRYPFITSVLAGEAGHYRYTRANPRGDLANYSMERYQRFDWNTPLNGGSGFTWRGDAYLWRSHQERYRAGRAYHCHADEIHTIVIDKPDTVLLLYQMEDVVPVGQPTSTWVPGSDREPPALAGLYDRMTEDRAVQLLGVLDDIVRRRVA